MHVLKRLSDFPSKYQRFAFFKLERDSRGRVVLCAMEC